MEYVTGIITKTSDFTSVVSVLINGKSRLFAFGRATFYSYGLKCDGRMSNILEEGMEVCLCYRLSPFGEVSIQAVWCGDPPETVEDAGASPNLYDQRGSVSYFIDDDNFLVQNDGGHYTVMISADVVYSDGRRMRDNGVAVSIGDVVMYDATPFDVEHPSGASYRASCAWLGTQAPRLMDRFNLQSMNVRKELFQHDVHGVVVTVPNEGIAVVEVMAQPDALKVLAFRSSFRIDCVSIRDEVAVGDILLMRLGHLASSDSKLLVAMKAVKLNQDLQNNDVCTESQKFVMGDETELRHVLRRTDEVCLETLNCVIDKGDKMNDCLLQKCVEVPDKFQNNVQSVLKPNNESYRCDVRDEKSEICYFASDDGFVSHNGLFERKGHVKQVDDAPLSSQNGGSNVGSALNSPTKHFNHVRSGTVSGRLLLNNQTPNAPKSVTEKTVRNYVGLGVKSVESTEGVKEVIEVADVISTYSAVLQVGKPHETCEPKTNNSFAELKNDCRIKQPVFTTDLTASDKSHVKNSNVVKLKKTDGRNVNGIRVIPSGICLDGKSIEDSILCDNVSTLCTNGNGNGQPLKGVFSRYSLDCGMISFRNFKIFVKPDNFYIDGVLCPLKHFIKFAKPGKSTVCFEAVSQSSVTKNAEFSHEATCAWVGRKPSLVDVSKNLPPPKLSLLELQDQYFCGIVSKLYLPDVALVVIQGDPTTVIVNVKSFTKPQYSDSVGHLISDYVELFDTLMFKVTEFDSESNLLVAQDVRNQKK